MQRYLSAWVMVLSSVDGEINLAEIDLTEINLTGRIDFIQLQLSDILWMCQ